MIELQATDREAFGRVCAELDARDIEWSDVGGNRVRIDDVIQLDAVFDMGAWEDVAEFTWDPKDRVVPADEDETVVPLSEEEAAASEDDR